MMKKLANKKYIMSEPVWQWSECADDPKKTEWLWVRAVHWYRCNADIKKKKGWVLQYVKLHMSGENVSDYKNAKQSLYEDAGCFCKVKMTGCKNEVLDSKIGSMLSAIKSSCIEQNAKTSSSSKAPKPAIKKVNVSDSTSNYCTEVNQMIDLFVNTKNINKKDWFNLDEWMTKNKIKQEQASQIMIEMKSLHNELLSAYQKEDEQIAEAYSFMSHKSLHRLVDFVSGLAEQSEEYVNGQSPKKTTKKKVSPEKMVKKLPKKDSMPEYGIEGVDPKKIVGASALFVYNTVSRLIICYFAKPGNGGLGVSGASITHYDEKTSFMKKVRSPKHTLNIVGRLTKKHVIEEIEKITTAKKEVRPRLNKNCVIVRVI